MYEFLNGGAEKAKRLLELRLLFKKADLGKDPSQIEKNRIDIIGETIAKSVQKKFPLLVDNDMIVGSLPGNILLDQQEHLMGSVGQLMSRKLIDLTATEKQKAKWLPMIDKHIYVCAYVQTELSHGTDVQGLKTVATFDR